MKVKIIMLVEANGNTGVYIADSPAQEETKTKKIGTGAALYEMLTCICKEKIALDTGTAFPGVELGFFKDRFRYFDSEELLKYDSDDQLPDSFFTNIMFRQFADKNTELFRRTWHGSLCTGEAIGKVLGKLADSKTYSLGSGSPDRTGFVFVSDSQTVFSGIGDYLPARDQLPDLSVFCVNQSAVVSGSRFISSFQSGSNEVKIIDYASVQDNLAQGIADFRRQYSEGMVTTGAIVKYCLEKKYGVAYSLYDAVKNSFARRHSYAS